MSGTGEYDNNNDLHDRMSELASSAVSSQGNINVELQDQTSEIIDLLVTQKLDDLTILVNTNVDEKTANIETTGVTPAVGNYVCFKEGTAFYQGRIQNVTPIAGNQYTIGLDSLLDYPFTTSGGCALTSPDMNVDGSVTPVVFRVSPALLEAGTRWDITRMMLTITDSSAMDDGKFGGAPPLNNGVIVRVKYNGTRKNIFTVRENGEFRLRAYDVSYLDATLGPAGLESMGVRRSFNGQDKNGVAIRLVNDDDPDEFQIIVQDDLTVLDSFRVVVQGHIVAD